MTLIIRVFCVLRDIVEKHTSTPYTETQEHLIQASGTQYENNCSSFSRVRMLFEHNYSTDEPSKFRFIDYIERKDMKVSISYNLSNFQ